MKVKEQLYNRTLCVLYLVPDRRMYNVGPDHHRMLKIKYTFIIIIIILSLLLVVVVVSSSISSSGSSSKLDRTHFPDGSLRVELNLSV